MENVLLIIHLIFAAVLIGLVLLQRSEGGALGIGGGGGGLVSSRGAATGIAKATWAIAAGFIITSLALTIIAAQDSGSRSVLDRIGAPGASAPAGGDGQLDPDLQKLLSPPAADGSSSAPAGAPAAPAPIAPPSAD